MDDRTRKLYGDEMFHVRRSVKYHDRRKRFFESVMSFALFLGFVAGPSFVLIGMYTDGSAPIQGQEDTAVAVADWVKYVPAIVTSIVTGWALLAKANIKANLHDRLRSDYIRLRQEMERAKTDCTEQDVARFTATRTAIEDGEPPVKRVVDAICHNEVCLSLGVRKITSYVKVQPWHRWFGSFTHLFDEGPRLYRQDEKAPNWMPTGV